MTRPDKQATTPATNTAQPSTEQPSTEQLAECYRNAAAASRRCWKTLNTPDYPVAVIEWFMVTNELEAERKRCRLPSYDQR